MRRNRWMRGGAAVLLAGGVLAAGACGSSDADPIDEDSSSAVPVQPDQLVGDPEAYDGDIVTIEGTAQEDLDDDPRGVVLAEGDLLVIAPDKPEDVPRGTPVIVTGSFHTYSYEGPAVENASQNEFIDRDGDWAVFATSFEVAAPPGGDPATVPSTGTGSEEDADDAPDDEGAGDSVPDQGVTGSQERNGN